MAYPNYYQGGFYPQYQNGAVPDMLNQFKGAYQQQIPMQQPVQQMPLLQQMPANDMIFVIPRRAKQQRYFVGQKQ